MNTQFYSLYPLPDALNHAPQVRFNRRRQVAGFVPGNATLDHYNRVLADLGRSAEPLQLDGLATAARELVDRTAAAATPPCIAERMQWAQALAKMLNDHGWQIDEAVSRHAHAVYDYLHDPQHLLPESLPRLAHLDDALVIETAWPRLTNEVACYADFRRLRRREAHRRGCAEQDLAFDRARWHQACRDEALQAHYRQVRESSYLPVPPDYFRVH